MWTAPAYRKDDVGTADRPDEGNPALFFSRLSRLGLLKHLRPEIARRREVSAGKLRLAHAARNKFFFTGVKIWDTPVFLSALVVGAQRTVFGCGGTFVKVANAP
jgi:hypothetical protein